VPVSQRDIGSLLPVVGAQNDPVGAGRHAGEKCSSAGHSTCPVFQARAEEAVDAGICPYLRESLMQYCGAAPIAKFVPYSESRCRVAATIVIATASCTWRWPTRSPRRGDGSRCRRLEYSANHMWLDTTEDGICHAGIDAFLSRALGKIERISYVWTKGRRRPTAVLTVAGCDLEVVSPTSSS